MDLENRILRSNCNCSRPPDDFRSNKQGKQKKTCYRHEKERALPALDQWDKFVHEIRAWNQTNHDKPLDIKCIFDLNQLPVSFGSRLERSLTGVLDREPLNQAATHLLEIIWKAGGYRFWHKRITQDSGVAYEYHCCQDSSKESRSVGKGKRDTRRMERFQCESKLRLRPLLEDRTLTVTLHHLYHSPYVDIHLSPTILEFVNVRVSSWTPSEVYRDLVASGIPDNKYVAQHQIYYQWQQANASMWRRDSDQFVSAKPSWLGPVASPE